MEKEIEKDKKKKNGGRVRKLKLGKNQIFLQFSLFLTISGVFEKKQLPLFVSLSLSFPLFLGFLIHFLLLHYHCILFFG